MPKKCDYTFEINKDILAKFGKRIDWNKVNEIEVYCKELDNVYKIQILDKKRDKRSSLYLLFKYMEKQSSLYIRTNNLTNGRLKTVFQELGIIAKEVEQENELMKRCNVCGEIKKISEFEKNKSCKYGHVGTCKVCRFDRRKKFNKVCETCKKEFRTINIKTKFCSVQCKPQCQNKKIIVKCSTCGKEKKVNMFRFKNNKDFYCSEKCKNMGYSKKYSGKNSHKYSRITVNCSICNKEITRNKYEINKPKYNFCSFECKAKGIKKFYSGENSPMYGRERLELRGEKNPNYNPNKTREQRQKDRKLLENTNWIKDILKRDKYICKCCGKKGNNMVAHHLDGYNWCKEKRYDIHNGVTLCQKCHKEFHSYYGYGNNTREQYYEFLYLYIDGVFDKEKQKINKNYNNNRSCKKVICITTNEIFNSLTEGANKYNISIQAISNNIRKPLKNKHAGVHPQSNQALIWKYYDSSK
ncbi:HNH endonuclease signature motif containing protein [Clostridium perfringens]|nr:HNH endonuclease signature motif containing protein [Clostridium perfringens]